MSGEVGKRVRVLRDCDLPQDALPIGRCVAEQRAQGGGIRWIVVLDVKRHTETWEKVQRATMKGYCCTGLVLAFDDKDIELIQVSP